MAGMISVLWHHLITHTTQAISSEYLSLIQLQTIHIHNMEIPSNMAQEHGSLLCLLPVVEAWSGLSEC